MINKIMVLHKDDLLLKERNNMSGVYALPEKKKQHCGNIEIFHDYDGSILNDIINALNEHNVRDCIFSIEENESDGKAEAKSS